MTKREARERKASWNKAVDDGRVVRCDAGLRFRAFPTIEAMRTFVAEAQKAGMLVQIVDYRK
jgi:hypothetical protein